METRVVLSMELASVSFKHKDQGFDRRTVSRRDVTSETDQNYLEKVVETAEFAQDI
jgi:hypothetical protein